jgi:hypothetical protein
MSLTKSCEKVAEKVAEKYGCKVCHYNTSKKSSYDKHITSRKHAVNATQKLDNIKVADNCSYTCSTCDKFYKSRVGLWKHTKVCKMVEEIHSPEPEIKLEIKPEPEPDPDIKNIIIQDLSNNIVQLLINENKDFKNIILDLVKTNTDLKKQMMEVCKNGITNNTTINTNNTSNSHNKTFNLQFFLNEQCKDAMNIMDFVNTFQLSLSDFERIGEVGYVEGISSIVIDKLNQMDVYKRPIHCSDAKRETMHVKDNDVWVKDASANDKIRLALKHITKKNTDLIRPWLNAHPGVLNSEHRLNDKYQEMFIEAMGGRKNKNMKEGEDKIIKKICKMVLIDKCNGYKNM